MRRTREQLLRIVAIQTRLAREDMEIHRPFGGQPARQAARTFARYDHLLWDLATENGTKTREDIDARAR